MSIEAINWVLNHAPDFAEEDARRRPHLVLVLIGLANHADPAGRDAFPSIETLCRYTRLSESTVRRCLQRLLELGTIRLGDPDLRALRIRQKHRRPEVYDLAMTSPEGVSHGTGQPAADPVDNSADGVSYGHPKPSTGVSHQAERGVIPTENRPRMTPDPSLNQKKNRPARVRAPEGAAAPTSTRPPASSSVRPECGQCDARPGDPVSARVVWLDEEHERSAPCPRCSTSVGGAR